MDHVLAVEEAVAQVTAEAAAIGQYALDPDNVYEEFCGFRACAIFNFDMIICQHPTHLTVVIWTFVVS